MSKNENKAASEINGEKKNNTTRNMIIWLLIAVLIACGAFFFTRNYIVRWPIEGTSMLNTVEDNDYVLIFATQNVHYDDIIVFYSETKGKNLIKRVIGKEGDIIQTKYSAEEQCFHVYRNGEMVDETHIREKMVASGGYRETEVTVPAGSFYVLGDNRNVSDDSHYGVFAEKENIHGIAFIRFTDISDVKILS